MFKVKNEATKATIYLYGTIGSDFWDPDSSNLAKDFAALLDEVSPKPIDIHIDSPGGDVYEGFAIASAIQRYEGTTCSYIDGMAASAASYIALMSDRIVMNDYAHLMIHNASAAGYGNRDYFADLIDRLKMVDEAIAKMIEKRSCLTYDEVCSAMTAETWYTAEDAEIAGMCDEVAETEERIAATIDRSIAARYRNIPSSVSIVDGVSHAREVPVESNSNLLISIDGSEKPQSVILGNRVFTRKGKDI